MFVFDKDSDVVISAWGEHCSGPGWSNTPIWVLVRSRLDGTLRLEAIQPNEQTTIMHTLFPYSSRSTADLVREVNANLSTT